MRIEKTFLLNEVSNKVKESNFLYLVDFNRLTVSETAELRKALAAEGAQFHVVQNTLLIGEGLRNAHHRKDNFFVCHICLFLFISLYQAKILN